MLPHSQKRIQHLHQWKCRKVTWISTSQPLKSLTLIYWNFKTSYQNAPSLICSLSFTQRHLSILGLIPRNILLCLLSVEVVPSVAQDLALTSCTDTTMCTNRVPQEDGKHSWSAVSLGFSSWRVIFHPSSWAALCRGLAQSHQGSNPELYSLWSYCVCWVLWVWGWRCWSSWSSSSQELLSSCIPLPTALWAHGTSHPAAGCGEEKGSKVLDSPVPPSTPSAARHPQQTHYPLLP